MPNITKDERKVNRAQRLYDDSVDKYLNLIEKINDDIPEIVDLLHGYAMGKKEEKYQLTSAQYGALKEQLNIWKANVQNPEKILANINNKLKKVHKTNKLGDDPKPSESEKGSDKPNLAVFRPKAAE